MNNYDDHIQFAENVIERSQLPESQKGELHQLIQRIQQRQNDPNLYLAVIGEFSSGKSTFINALIRDNLLKTSALVTTAAATRLRYSEEINIEINFRELPEIIRTQSNCGTTIISCLVGFLQKLGFNLNTITAVENLLDRYMTPIFNSLDGSNNLTKIITSEDIRAKGIDIREFINKVTSEEAIAKEVEKIDITHPATFLQNNIVIIDLPGTNAPNTRHAQVTREVVEKEADVAIIIIPATQPLTDSLAEFLTATIRPYLHRCIFVVSRMDQIRQKEHNRMLANVRDRLVDQLEINPSRLYSCSAQVVMDDVEVEQHRVNNPDFWIEQFTQVQVEIIERLHSERRAIISESIQGLFGQLFEHIKNHLQAQWNQYRQKEAQIQSETIQDLESFKNQQYRECISMIDRANTRTENTINDCIESYRDRTLSIVRDAIFSASDWDELKYVVNTKVETILQEQQNLLSSSIQSECRNLSQSAQEAGQYFDKKFTEVYRSLQALGGRVETNSVFSSSSISINTYSVIASAQELNSSNFGNAMSGFFSRAFRGLLDGRKEKILNEIRPKLYSCFTEIKTQVQPTVKKDADHIKTAINQRINAYITHYKSVVDSMLNEQKMELQRLTQLQATIQSDLADIERRRLQIRVNSN
ncbi:MULTISPECIES: dynamin family protein [unclassified Microcoleus]|uniref:dynamin family protein n=1 Tax=unclassified Microcoleus TaxID=2642155 RepID=UPI002FD0CFC3